MNRSSSNVSSFTSFEQLESRNLRSASPLAANVPNEASTLAVVAKPATVAMVKHAGTNLTWATPHGWHSKETNSGLELTSADGKTIVSSETILVTGKVTSKSIVDNLKSAGVTVVNDKGVIKNKNYQGFRINEDSALVSFKDDKGKLFATGATIQTVYKAGKTIIEISGVTTAKKDFVRLDDTGIKVLKSIAVKPVTAKMNTMSLHSKTATASDYWGDGSYNFSDSYLWDYSGYNYTGGYYGDVYGGGYYDPGVSGNWAYDFGTTYSDPYVAYEQSSMAYQSSVYDASNDAWDAYISE